MKILIKATIETKLVMQRKGYYWHSANYYPFSFYKAFTDLGHEVKFYGDIKNKIIIDNFEYEIITDYSGYDMMFWRGLESFTFDKPFSIKTAKEFPGINCISLGTMSKNPILEHFDWMMPTENEEYVKFYKKEFKNLKVSKIPLASPCFDFVDKEKNNPFKNNDFKIIFTGIIHSRYLDFFTKLAEKGEQIYLGGTYYPDKERIAKSGVRPFNSEEIKNLHSNIHLITQNGRFNYGHQFKYFKHANLGLALYPANRPHALSCKIPDYLICGLPVLAENTIPNANRITQLNAGQIIQWNNFNKLYEAVRVEKELNRNHNNIQTEARKLFNIKDCCNLILRNIYE